MRDHEKQWATAAVINKDSKYFGYLVEEHQLAVRGYLRRLTRGNGTLADDLAQETFLNAFRKITTFKQNASFKTWLFSIAYRCFLMHIRKNASDPLDNAAADELEAEDKTSPHTDQLIDKIDMEKAIARLKKNERSTLTLCYSYGMSHGEIAAIMDMPLGTVKSHILRGKEKLAKILTPATEDMLC